MCLFHVSLIDNLSSKQLQGDLPVFFVPVLNVPFYGGLESRILRLDGVQFVNSHRSLIYACNSLRMCIKFWHLSNKSIQCSPCFLYHLAMSSIPFPLARGIAQQSKGSIAEYLSSVVAAVLVRGTLSLVRLGTVQTFGRGG